MTGSAMAAIRSTSSTRGLVVSATCVTQPPRSGEPNHTVGTAGEYTMKHGGARVLSLQAVGRRRRGARLLDYHGSGVDRGPLGGSAGGLGAAARDRSGVRRAAHLRIPQLNHVLAESLLFLRPPEAEASRGVRLSGPDRACAAGEARHAVVEGEDGSHHYHH